MERGAKPVNFRCSYICIYYVYNSMYAQKRKMASLLVFYFITDL